LLIFESSSFNKLFKLQARRVEKQGVAQQTVAKIGVAASWLQFGLLASFARGIQTQLQSPLLSLQSTVGCKCKKATADNLLLKNRKEKRK
jgi:hypothetical protein